MCMEATTPPSWSELATMSARLEDICRVGEVRRRLTSRAMDADFHDLTFGTYPYSTIFSELSITKDTQLHPHAEHLSAKTFERELPQISLPTLTVIGRKSVNLALNNDGEPTLAVVVEAFAEDDFPVAVARITPAIEVLAGDPLLGRYVSELGRLLLTVTPDDVGIHS